MLAVANGARLWWAVLRQALPRPGIGKLWSTEGHSVYAEMFGRIFGVSAICVIGWGIAETFSQMG